MIDNRRPGSSWLLVLLVGLIIILSGTLLLRWRALAAPVASAALPTAYVSAATPASGVALAAQVRLRLAPPVPDAVNLPPAPATATPAVAQAATPAPEQPLPTLFPTQPPAPPAPADGQATLVPILMYHYIRTVDAAADPLGYNLSVTPESFEQQIAWLQQQGYTGVTMATAQRCMRGGGCPARAIALTFDDGYEDAYSAALPVLQRYGMLATFYIVNSFVGQPGYMSWEQIAAMRDAGMEIGAHSISHLNLTTLDQAGAADEIGRSKAEIDSRLGISVTSFCYPAGFYDATIEALVQAAGYANATTTRWDADYSDQLALPRRRVSGDTSIDGFVGIVTGG